MVVCRLFPLSRDRYDNDRYDHDRYDHDRYEHADLHRAGAGECQPDGRDDLSGRGGFRAGACDVLPACQRVGLRRQRGIGDLLRQRRRAADRQHVALRLRLDGRRRGHPQRLRGRQGHAWSDHPVDRDPGQLGHLAGQGLHRGRGERVHRRLGVLDLSGRAHRRAPVRRRRGRPGHHGGRIPRRSGQRTRGGQRLLGGRHRLPVPHRDHRGDGV